MQLQLQDFTALVRTQAAAVTNACSQLIDMTVGSVLRAVLEANAAVGLWIQWLIVEVLATTRAATSTGADLDSWVADFGLSRLPAISAYGTVTFSRTTPGFAAMVPAGSVVRTGLDTNAQSFFVVPDGGNAAWTGIGYAIVAGSAAVSVPVVAHVAGRGGNVQAGAIRLLSSAIPGVDAVTNDAPLAGGLDAEADEALRTRFGGFIDSRTRATAQAVGFAIQSLQQGLQFTIREREDTTGAVRAGHFTVTVDDGSGVPSAALLNRVAAAIEPIRPVGGTYSVRAPLVVGVSVGLQVTGPAAAIAAVRAAVGAYIAALPIGAPLYRSRLVQVALDADTHISNVANVTINGTATDMGPPPYGLVRASSILVTA